MDVEHHDALDEQPVAGVNVFRREGDYWSVIFEGRTLRVRDLKGMRYLARLLADPDGEFHVLDLVVAETGAGAQEGSVQAAGLSRSALGDAGEILDARAKDAYRRRLAEIETTSTERAPSGTANGPSRRTPNATSSFESSHAPWGWVVAIEEAHPCPSAPELV